VPSGEPLLRNAVVSPAATVGMTYDGDPITAYATDTVTSALFAAGIVATGRSLKYRRPRGPFCLRGDCGTCLLRQGGVPNERACVSPVSEGLAIEPQNRVLPGGPDPTALVDRMFSDQLDHHHLMVRPKIVNRVMQEVARNLAGLGTLPDADPLPVVAQTIDVDVLVVGGGPSGRAVAQALRSPTISVACLERFGDPTAHGDVRTSTAVFGIYPAEGLVAAVDASGGGRVLQSWRPRHVVLATGARDVILPLRNNDLPGVVAAAGLLAMLRRTGRTLACPTVVVGDGPTAQRLATQLGVDALATDDVVAVLGGGRVEAVSVRAGASRSGKREVGCVALAAPPAPASELARQAGARVHWQGGGFVVDREPDGRVAGPGPWQLWACGQVCGVDADASAADGSRVAEHVAQALARQGARR
jgi:sarcosine oxidase subunit alpha